jgi:hypothetical protein
MRRRNRRTIRGPTPPNDATDHAGNAVGGEKHRGGSGINQPGLGTSFLAPGLSVGRKGASVKVARRVGARGVARVQATGAAGNRTGLVACAATRTLPLQESGMMQDG